MVPSNIAHTNFLSTKGDSWKEELVNPPENSSRMKLTWSPEKRILLPTPSPKFYTFCLRAISTPSSPPSAICHYHELSISSSPRCSTTKRMERQVKHMRNATPLHHAACPASRPAMLPRSPGISGLGWMLRYMHHSRATSIPSVV